MRKDQFEASCRWQRETFGQPTTLSKIHHLKQELEELHLELKLEAGWKIIEPKPGMIAAEQLYPNRSRTLLEFADCFLLLFGTADAAGLNYDDICAAIDAKMSINRERNWGKPDANGVVNHIKH